MKRYGCLFPEIVSTENIGWAFDLALLGKKQRPSLQRYVNKKDSCVQTIQESLINGTYQTSDYYIKTIFEPKERLIYILPFYPDRIVQHAIMNIIAPIWDSFFIDDSYCCRKGKGQHKGSMRLTELIPYNEYFLKGDISKFYPNMNHAILLSIIEHKIKDRKVLWLFDNIINSIEGETNIPIGNYTSQWFGNLYLNELDQWLKNQYKIKCYLRYSDDFVVLSNDKGLLQELRVAIPEFLYANLKLTMSRNDLAKTSQGIDFLGYRHFPNRFKLVRKSTSERISGIVKTLYTWYYGAPDYTHTMDELVRTRSILASYIGLLDHANSYNFKITHGIINLYEEIVNDIRTREKYGLFPSGGDGYFSRS